MNALAIAKDVVKVCLEQGDRADSFVPETPLMGAMPEFNSLTIVAIVTTLEERLDCEIFDEELEAEIFETVGSLAKFIESKM
ncbi:acyl carrier protein [Pseudomaricurvus alkylphenolicus]|uniref:acyl carrier protein n=1 Tax=Pseudomaricurvus alkylphenolicus TaxID=1306991 RepID=UPI00141FD858|nr:phosphopantetheine-binding protein [Pseudomaricurvus alkylphenolicus]NIB43117.1 acyl carrier protein [Pseudomaricurvus alkylphenolicus]